ncbi:MULTISPECIES: hypothetical protein [Corallococcus]|uniref:hypothetical protein n=1 Tax=Corallococcus TaxID=83461 RepID=UPI00117D3C61|nr:MULTISPECIES: hypothetical protein [Corallococcus]NBD13171.1 hypothetical protein [Corallococcus silvisoli]TSC23308.1 hypothetical protein FOF48_29835 [Corallococcus sp. Z5C101001]
MLRKSLLCASLLFAGCNDAQSTDADTFRDGLPSKEMTQVKAPKQNGQGLTAEGPSAMYGQGQKAEYYQATVAATLAVNGGTLWVLGLIEQITKYPPTTLEENKAVWGPSTEALSPTTWRLTVTKSGDASFSWVLEGKAKAADDSAFRAVLSGTQVVAVDANGERMKGFGSGELLIDWDASRTLPDADDNVGTVEIRYARPSATAEATVDADFHQVRDENDASKRVDGNYHYKASATAGGEFEFATYKDIDNGNPLRAKLEKLSIKSRWAATGVGRSDVKVTGGDLVGEATLNECWDANFLSTYFRVSLDPRLGYGEVEAACGGFNAAVYSSL